MFTGLIQELSEIVEAKSGNGGYELSVLRPTSFTDLETGESIAVDGTCLTLVSFSEKIMTFFVGGETIDKTTFSSAPPKRPVNLERSLRAGDRMGGHFVTGHIDGTAKVKKVSPSGDCLGLSLTLSHQQFKYVVPKGSLALNGVSLTINDVNRETLQVDLLLIPETLKRTNLSALKAGDTVNLECDQTVKIMAQHVTEYMSANMVGGFREHHT